MVGQFPFEDRNNLKFGNVSGVSSLWDTETQGWDKIGNDIHSDQPDTDFTYQQNNLSMNRAKISLPFQNLITIEELTTMNKAIGNGLIIVEVKYRPTTASPEVMYNTEDLHSVSIGGLKSVYQHVTTADEDLSSNPIVFLTQLFLSLLGI